jgi:RNA-directed DNA polymerase
VVNGPEDPPPEPGLDAVDWDWVDWSGCEREVRRLRQRIFKATQEGDWPRVRSLQKLMLRSRSNTLLSVRQVTQRNAGRKTAGIDGEVALTSQARADVAARVRSTIATWQPPAVKRVYIPKAANRAKLRPLGIPVIMDRCHQARVRNALEPEWEARFEPRSYGFRPGRSCQDAMQAIFVTARGATCRRQWVLDADLAAAFDQIDHARLLDRLGGFPARGTIEAWLRSGVIDHGRFAPTERGSPQGGVISPVLMNVALHGMEEAAGVRYIPTGANAGTARPGSPVVIRYADDLLALCHSREQAEQVKARLAGWLAPRGLVFNEDKTRIVHLDDGVDFLGFNVRRYRGKLLIKPSTAAVKLIRARLTPRCGRCAGTTRRWFSSGSTRLSAGGRPTTGMSCPLECSTSWTATCGCSSTSGRSCLIRTSRSTGSSPGTSARSTPAGGTGGSSAIATAAPTCSSSPGRRSLGTRW